MSDIVRAPAGWGYSPGCILSGVDASSLPDLPLLHSIREARERNRVVEQAIRSVPGLAEKVRVRDLKHKYALPDVVASNIAARLRT